MDRSFRWDLSGLLDRLLLSLRWDLSGLLDLLLLSFHWDLSDPLDLSLLSFHWGLLDLLDHLPGPLLRLRPAGRWARSDLAHQSHQCLPLRRGCHLRRPVR